MMLILVLFHRVLQSITMPARQTCFYSILIPYELGSVNHLSLKFQQRRKAQPTAPLSLFTLASMMKSFLNLSRLGISFWGLFSFSFWVLKKKGTEKETRATKNFSSSYGEYNMGRSCHLSSPELCVLGQFTTTKASAFFALVQVL